MNDELQSFIDTYGDNRYEIPHIELDFDIWNQEESLELTTEYGINESLGNSYFAFGGDGGNEILVYNSENQHIYMIPAIPMEAKYLQLVSTSIAEFKKYIFTIN